MGNGDGIGVDYLNMICSLTKSVLKNKDNPKFNEYVKIWLYEAIDLPKNFNHILAGLLILIKETEYDFKNQTRLLKKLEDKISSVSDDAAQKLAEYYRIQLKIQ